MRVLSAAELYASVPELANYASIEPEVLLSDTARTLGQSTGH